MLQTLGKSDPEIASIGGSSVLISRRSRVFGIYRTVEDVESAVDQLFQAGLTGEDIAVLHAENGSTREFARRKGHSIAGGHCSLQDGITSSGRHIGAAPPGHRASPGSPYAGSCRHARPGRLVRAARRSRQGADFSGK